MKVRKIPERSCIVTREKLPKMELIRVIRTKEGEVKVDLTGKLNGRGAYLKKDIDVINKAENTKILNRVFNCGEFKCVSIFTIVSLIIPARSANFC